jgi:acetyl esterase
MSSHHPNPRSLLSPAMRGVIDRIARAGHVPMHALTPDQAKAAYAAGAGVLDIPPHKLARVEDLVISARDGAELPARLYAPASDHPLPVLLYLHGGGFTVGSIATHEPLCRHLAHLAHCAVVSLDYRLAPEWKFPTAVHDAWDSLAWLREQAASLRLDGSRIAIGGDSAGGTLAAVTAIAARDAGWPLALQLLFYPGWLATRTRPATRPLPTASSLKNRTSAISSATTCVARRTGTTGASPRWTGSTRPARCATWTAWHRPGSVWPSATA